jgi:hypothetical protein
VEILFSQGPTQHSRLANSLLWMARAFPDLQRGDGANFLFPWARERFADTLHSRSPWLVNPRERARALFLQVTGSALTAHALAGLSQQLLATAEPDPEGGGQGPAGQRPAGLGLRLVINGVDLAFFGGENLNFASCLERASQADLAIFHEPFNFQFSGPRFPEEGLDHLAPAEALLAQALQRQAVLNGAGRQCCGLHIRRGDYAHWRDGMYFYPDPFWLNLCERRIAAGFHVSVFTNDPQAELCGRLEDLGAHLSGGSPGQDLVGMMHMDKVSGPPSTFPLMARALAKSCLGRSLEYEMFAGLPDMPSAPA